MICETATSSSVAAAVGFLARAQQPWGEVCARRYNNPRLIGTGLFDSSPFATTFVLYALGAVTHPGAEPVRAAALSFLHSELEPPGLWRYWTSRQGVAIDPDLDDTACAAFALWGAQHGADPPNLRIILENRHPCGLFKTWLRHHDAHNDIDCAVNANVLLLLGEREETIPARDRVIQTILDGGEESACWYYPDRLALYYLISRAFRHGVQGFSACRDAILRQTIRNIQDPSCTALGLAMGICILCNFEHRSEDAVPDALEHLLAAQSADGSWPRAALYTGPEPPSSHLVWWGSEELTTAFCVEAITRSQLSTKGRQ